MFVVIGWILHIVMSRGELGISPFSARTARIDAAGTDETAAAIMRVVPRGYGVPTAVVYRRHVAGGDAHVLGDGAYSGNGNVLVRP